MRKRLLLDVTKTYESQFSTGIQRVVREVVRRADRLGRDLDMDMVIVVASNGGYFRLDDAGMQRLLSPPPAKGGAMVTQSRLAQRVKALLQSNAMLYAAMQRRILDRRLKALTTGLAPVPVGSDDVVALIDYFGAGSPSVPAIRNAHCQGAATVAIIYDVIPLVHRDMVPATTAYPFEWAFKRVVPILDGAITISKSEADLIRALPLVKQAGLPVASFYLGQDLRTVDTVAGDTTIPTQAWTNGPTFVMVGTIEPRKRNAAILAAFDQLWSQGCAANLVMIGRIGWEIDTFVEQVKRHSRNGSSLFLCHQVDDAELHAAMTRADAIVMASKAEGFGLPIVEALSLGVPVIASDIPIFREIAGDAGCYFPPDDTDGTAAVIRDFIDYPEEYRRAAQAFRWIDWDQSVAEFAAAANTVLKRSTSSAPVGR